MNFANMHDITLFYQHVDTDDSHFPLGDGCAKMLFQMLPGLTKFYPSRLLKGINLRS